MIKGWLRKRLFGEHQVMDDISVSKKAGLPPGSLVHVGNRKTKSARVTVIDYTDTELIEKELKNSSEYDAYLNSEKNTWINLDGIDQVSEVEKLGNKFGLHVLLIEDLLNTEQRPKIEILDDHVFLSIKMLKLKEFGEDEYKIDQEQLTFVLGKGWLLSFQEEVGDVFETIRNRIQDPTTMIRRQSIDYLFYRLIDTIVDNYFVIIERISDSIEDLEGELADELKENIRWKIQIVKKELVQLRKAVMPLREVIGSLAKEENKFIKKGTTRYFHDVYEHIIQLNDYIDTQRDMLSSLVELYVSGVSFKMNQIMKVLTIISTIFIPLTFIAGIYGMNFDNMPELHWENGYFFVMGMMVVIFIFMLFYFRKKDWL